MRTKNTTFSAIRRGSWLTAWTMSIILMHACCAFIYKLGNIDPFLQAITISSIRNKAFRTILLKPDTVCIIPRAGYRMGDNQSVEDLQWLLYIGRTRNNITHAGNGR